eukprot:jgi/Psemu1/204022/e_gw1.338.51.1
MASSSSLLRVLCLHDAGSNSVELSQKLDSLGNQLYRQHGIDLVFVDAPLIVRDSASTRDSKDASSNYPRPRDIRDNPPRAGPVAAAAAAANPPHYVGLDASLLLLRQVWVSSPFWGILAVGQAAGVAALLPLLPSRDGRQPQPPSFMVFAHGGSLLGEEEALTNPLELPCLHVVDDRLPETTPAAESARRLVRQFGGTVVSDHSLSPLSGPSSSSSADFNNHVGRFLVARKKELRTNVRDASTILALRHDLHRTETDAAQLVARHIAENPPNALMAVITPRDVGGFRDRRRGPGEEGGGAPCPSEFLLHRAKRSTTQNHQTTTNNNNNDSEAASRHHPNQQ